MPTPGKPYTMGEMRTIVDYLVQHKAYGQIRARKMWQDFSRSGVTNRTWQSLKETFLKRILPDIHNPYYKLTPEQKLSFKEGTDMEKTDNKIKLEIHTMSSSTGDSQEEPSAKDNSGEDKPIKMESRSKESTETVVLDTCYETAEDIVRDLESPRHDTTVNKSPSKSLRDLITYSEPLTPMAQEVIDDFATDEDEPQLQIDEDIEPVATSFRDDASTSSKTFPEIRKSGRMLSSTTEASEQSKSRKSESPDANKIRSLKLKKTHKGTWENQNAEDDGISIDGSKEHTKIDIDESGKEHDTAETGKKTDNKTVTDTSKGNLTSDTQLPNNQEQLHSKPDGENEVSDDKLNDESENAERPLTKRRLSATGNKPQLKNSSKAEQKKDNDGQESQVTIAIPNDEGTQTFDSHPNIKPNKTGQPVETTFNSHDNQVKADSLKATAGSDVATLSQITSNGTQEAGPSNKQDVINPCLKNVSLYAEQFSSLPYSDSDNEDTSKDNAQKQISTKKDEDKVHNPVVNSTKLPDINKEIKEVQSGNEAQLESDKDPKKPSHGRKPNRSVFPNDVVVLKSNSESEKRREKRRPSYPRLDALTKIFGFSRGAGPSNKRARVVKHKVHRLVRRRTISRNAVNCDDTGSSDYDTDSESEDLTRGRKQIPPESYEIMSHEGEQFVVLGKKLYPLMVFKDNKFHRVFGSESEGDGPSESYWKNKYMEEKNKSNAEKIRADKLARLLQAEQNKAWDEQPSRSPILPSRQFNCRNNKKDEDTIEIHSDTSKTSERGPPKIQEIPVKIKLNTNKEIELECHANHVTSVLEKMQSLFQTNNNPEVKETVPRREKPTRTPTPEVSEKVEKLENEIFKEIAEIDKIDDTNVTKRKRGRPRKATSKDSLEIPSLPKKIKAEAVDPQPHNSTSDSKDNSSLAEETSAAPKNTKQSNEPAEVQSKKSSRALKKSSNEAVTIKPAETQSTKVIIPEDDPNVRYKLPVARSRSDTRAPRKNVLPHLISRVPLSPASTSRHSIESSQGYQDSDFTPSPLKRKKKRSESLHRDRKSSHAKSHPYLADVDSYDNTQPFDSPAKTVKHNSTQNTSEYRSESYQNLMPKSKPNLEQLEKIDENSNNVRSVETRYFSLSPIVNTEFEINMQNSENNSSIASFPSSEISIVEKLSITKDILSLGDPPTINEIQSLESMEISGKSSGSKYMISEVDVTVPLMEQDCEVRDASKMAMSLSENVISAASKSLLKNIENVAAESSWDALDFKLKNLLLVSAKKMSQKIQDNESEKEAMEIDDIVSTIKKVRKHSTTSTKRRSRASTPLPSPVLEEHTESCAKGERQSCPPVINVIRCECPPIDGRAHLSLNAEAITTKICRRQKDVIKVKILKPKKKSLSKEKRAASSSRVSMCTDSSINDMETDSQVSDDIVGLIHNHSETCLQAKECIRESVEFLNPPDTVYREAKESTLDKLIAPMPLERTASNDKVTTELFCDNAQDATNLDHAQSLKQEVDSNTLSHGSLNSLITEDLSDESPTPKSSDWYLFSEDEASTVAEARPNNHNVNCGLHTNLKQLFSACAVPDLSTISEASREDISRRDTFDGNSNTY